MFRKFEINSFCFAVAIGDLVHDVKVQNAVSWASSYFRKYFHMLFVVKEGETQPPHRALGHIHV